ncbi:MAG: DUF3159 domain-containing protein [Nocardioidaceae bacterium]
MTDRPAAFESVEAVVRHQLSAALGGRRGMFEAGAPTLLFTAVWLTTKELPLALSLSLAAAVVLFVIRVVQRSTVQFVANALFGIGIGWFFVYLAGRGGGSEDDQALAFFLPGLIYSTGYSIVLAVSCLTRWPVVGFMLGSVTGDPTAWHRDRQVVALCTRLTWVLGLPGMIGVALQGPVWFAGWSGGIEADTAVLALSTLRYGLGWPLRFAALGLMTWLLARNHTPLVTEPEPAEEP